MRRITFATVVMLVAARVAHGQFAYMTLDYPGAQSTFLSGKDGNVIVGSYSNSTTSPQHGFIFDGSTFSTLDVPGSNSTVLTAIDGNRIVGFYDDASQRHGFIYQNGIFTTLNHPLADPNVFNGTEAQGVSGSKVVGGYYGTSGTRPYLYDGTNFSALNVPFSSTAAALGIDGNTIVGWFNSSGNSHGFVFDGASYTAFDYPLATSTLPLEVSGNNVVGYYIDTANVVHGFLWDHNSFTTLNEPPQMGRQFIPNGVDGGVLVGQYVSGSGSSVRHHGFVTIPEPASILPSAMIGALFHCLRRKKKDLARRSVR